MQKNMPTDCESHPFVCVSRQLDFDDVRLLSGEIQQHGQDYVINVLPAALYWHILRLLLDYVHLDHNSLLQN